MKTSCRSHALPTWLALGAATTLLLAGQSLATAENTNESSGPNGMDFQGMDFQGMDFQGMDFQGMDFQGPIVSSGLAADSFTATMPNGDIVEVNSFRGTSIDVTILDATTNVITTGTVASHELDGMIWYAPLCNDDGQCIDSWYRVAESGGTSATNTMPNHSSNDDISLARVELSVDLNSGIWQNVCGGDDIGMFVDGTWDADGTWNSAGFTYACAAGVVMKCALGWGYKPWVTLTADDGTSVDLQTLHRACTRAARADYCGDGVPHTVNGLLVDIHDVYGFNVNESGPGLSEEASFDIYGATSLKRRRVVNHPNPLDCNPGPVPSNNETPLLWVWSQPQVLPNENSNP